MKTIYVVGISAIVFSPLVASAQLATFDYTQLDSSIGSGTIGTFVAGGHTFNPTPMPPATVFNPNSGLTPAGFVGAQTIAVGNSNESNTAVGLLWSGVATASSDDGFLIDIPLVFVPKQTQTPTDLNDYTWNIRWGDSPASGIDTISSGNLRFGMYFSRDDLADGVETANTFQRYTQNANIAFVAGQDSFLNTDTSFNTVIKDAMDAGNPAGNDAVGRNLAFYWAWRDQASLTQGAILIDDFGVGGLLSPDLATLRSVPEPGTGLLVLAGSAILFRRRR